jgi:hypothetical protein
MYVLICKNDSQGGGGIIIHDVRRKLLRSAQEKKYVILFSLDETERERAGDSATFISKHDQDLRTKCASQARPRTEDIQKAALIVCCKPLQRESPTA